MNINLLMFTVLWMALTLFVIGLIAYRKWVARGEDDSIHIANHEAGIVTQQVVVAGKLDSIDRWGKALTVMALVYGVILAAAFLYQTWMASLNQ